MPIRPKLLILLSTSLPLRPSSAFRAARFSRQPLATFSSYAVSHGLHLPRSVFPKLGFWIREATQFNTQSVVKEGCDEAALSESKDPHPWPEWSKLADLLLEKGFLDREKAPGHDDDSFLVENLPEEFLKAAVACLGFARERPDILRLLSKRNVEAVTLSGPPFLFKNGENSASRMRLFLAVEGDNINQELELGKAETVDIMRYLLSYVYGIVSLSASKDLKVEEPVERSVRKLLVELFNLSSTVWKPKSTDATKIEPSSSNGHFSGPHEQFIDSRTGSWTSPKILGQSLDTAENQSDAPIKFSNAENVKSMSNQIQVPAEISSQYGGTSYVGTSYGGCNGNSAQRSANHLDKSWSNLLDKPKTSSISNGPLLNENTTNGFADSTQPSSNKEYNSWANSNASYSGPTANSSQPPGNSAYSYQSSYRRDTVNSSQPSSGSVSNSSTFYVRPSPNLSQPPINSMNSYNISYSGNSMNSTQPSSTSGSNRNTPYGGSSWNLSEPPSDSWNNSNTSYGGCPTNSTQPSSNSWANSNSSYCGGFTPNSSQPHQSSWNKYNTSYCDRTANSTQPSSDPWANSNSCYGRSAPNSIQPPSDPRNNYSTEYDGYIAKSQESSSSSWSNNNKSSGVFTNNSSQPPSNSMNNYNASHVGCSAALSNSWSHSSPSYSASSENSSYSPSLPPRESWNNYKTQYGGHAVKSSEPSSNSGSNNASFGWSTQSSQPPNDSWNHHNNNTTNNTKPSSSSWVSYSSSSSVSSSNSYHGNAAKSTLPSSSSWNNNGTSNHEANLNASHSSSNAWNNNRESWGSGFPQAKSVNGNFPRPAETQNACENESFGYSGKSLEGSCVKEPDPLDMSEEAKAERWFRRVAQIKDIQELSQIPDEDFPQIMPMRKGVNRFVVSKRKTPLERRLASQQYKRDLPVVSSEPEKERANGEGTT